jgi:murein tripeptide amidase MpaA
MLNPDGVALGNSRFSALGFDLNRKWVAPSPDLHPEIHKLRSMIQQLSKAEEISYIFDLHGHSKKTHFFCYGLLESPFSNVRTKRLPYLLA